jgi:hypothetical protein
MRLSAHPLYPVDTIGMETAHLTGRVCEVHDQRPVRRRKEEYEQDRNDEEEMIPASQSAGPLAALGRETTYFRMSEYSVELLALNPCWSDSPVALVIPSHTRLHKYRQ